MEPYAVMKRRTLLAASGALALPSVSRAQSGRVLRFIPQSDVTILDPIWTTAYVTRNHGFMLFDTLYGYDAQYRPQPQMVEGHTTEADGLVWTLRLRPGLLWHDGERVLARDCVASIQRWGKRDAYGSTLLALTDELSAPDDRTIRFRLKRPFPLLTDALAKPGSNFCAMMPERLARTDAFTQVTEMVGSGPFRFKADERVVGARAVYERNAAYQPREGAPSFTAGGKVVNFDRVEWMVIPDAGTAAAALQNGEADWWELVPGDLNALLKRDRRLRVEVKETTGNMGGLRMNHLHPPFDNPAIRRALLHAISQEDYTVAVAGTDPAMRHVPTGTFCPGTPMANDAGLDVLTAPRDPERARREIIAAGYKGEPVVLLAPTDFPILKALADVGADVMKRCGLNVDYQAMDWGTVVQRRGKKEPPAQGGWNVFHTFWQGLDQFNPAGHLFLRGHGAGAGNGWPTSPRLEELRTAWLESGPGSQAGIARSIQEQALQDLPYIPIGQIFYTGAYRTDLRDVPDGFALFWGVRRA